RLGAKHRRDGEAANQQTKRRGRQLLASREGDTALASESMGVRERGYDPAGARLSWRSNPTESSALAESVTILPGPETVNLANEVGPPPATGISAVAGGGEGVEGRDGGHAGTGGGGEDAAVRHVEGRRRCRRRRRRLAGEVDPAGGGPAGSGRVREEVGRRREGRHYGVPGAQDAGRLPEAADDALAVLHLHGAPQPLPLLLVRVLVAAQRLRVRELAAAELALVLAAVSAVPSPAGCRSGGGRG
ncbi:unnamed protein product, partial [Musa acuminata var. zebrina]